MPPSIDSLDLPPFKPRFPWWGPDLQTLSVLLQSPGSDLSPHTSERLCFPMADRTGDILLGMLDRPEEPMANRPLVVLIHGLTGCEDSVYILSAARHLLDLGYAVLRLNVRGAGPSRAYCGEHYHVGRTADFRRVLWQLPEDLTSDGVVAVGYSAGGAMLLKYLGEEGSFSPLRAAATICAPIDLVSTARHMTKPRNWLYHNYILNGLRAEPLGEGARASDEESLHHPLGEECVRFRRPLRLFAAPRLQERRGLLRGSARRCTSCRRSASPRFWSWRRASDPWIPIDHYRTFKWSWDNAWLLVGAASVDRRPWRRLPRRCRATGRGPTSRSRSSWRAPAA